MRLRLRIAALAATVTALGVLAFAGLAQARHPPANGSCYPDNEFAVVAPGSFWAMTVGSGSGTAEIEEPTGTHDVPSVKATETKANVSWRFWQMVTGNAGPLYTVPSHGSMRGRLEVTVSWPELGLHTTTFVSNCIAEAALDNGGIEAELEGTVSNFPVHGKEAPTQAVGSITASSAGGHDVKYKIGVGLGKTCYEGTYGVDEWEFSVGGTGTGWFHAPANMTAGRAAVPHEFAPSSNPCPGVFF